MTPDDWRALKARDFARFAGHEQAVLNYAEKLTREPWAVSDSDFTGLRQHFSDTQIADLHLLIGEINLTNRFTDPLGLELEMAEIDG